jgi:Flp pilus assembly protein TadD
MLHCRLGLLLGIQGKPAKALEEIQQAVQMDPNNTEIRAVLGTVTRN